ncbi:MAG: phosphodiester glycosidase family protein [Chloroflexaceae bacterium]|nr:phosphodiester glycosidase family protein [Chloroflexaceae bacterium]
MKQFLSGRQGAGIGKSDYDCGSWRFSWLAGLILLSVASELPPAAACSVAAAPASLVPGNSVSNSPSQLLRQGSEMVLNGQTLAIAWSQWQQGEQVITGISDTAAQQVLGLQLLSSREIGEQPIRWQLDATTALVLKAYWRNPYRYLDVSELARLNGWQWQVVGGKLTLQTAPAKITALREEPAPLKRWLVELDRPVVWQISQTRTEATVTLGAIAEPSVAQSLKPGFLPSVVGQLLGNPPEKPLELIAANNQTQLKIPLGSGDRLQVHGLSKPNCLALAVQPEVSEKREIHWAEGIWWRQQLVTPAGTNGAFPVTWLELDGRSGNLAFKPITSNVQGAPGIAPLIATARQQGAAAAINAGFFNRNNQLPLGAIRRDNRWLSGPILNRGAIAWNDRGEIEIGRLQLQETLLTAKGTRLPVLHLNSGYVQAGISRYSPDWGASYTPLTDGERLIFVENDQIVRQVLGGKAGEGTHAIPRNGYLLVGRGNAAPAELIPGTTLTLESATVPPEFARYPHILAAGPLLISDRQIVLNAIAEKFSDAFNRQAAPRSAIATTEAGTVIVVAAHVSAIGKGATLAEMARIMQQLGAVDALNLDGGSSTSLYLGGQLIDRPGSTAARVHNGLGIFLRN